MDPYLIEWLNLLLRWTHLVVGSAWIGASFYFNWLNNHVRPEPDHPDRKALWAVHGGAFYQVTKYIGAPEELPETLHWFKWEAYTTWMTGVGLLLVVYWLQASAYMIDPSVADISASTAVAIGAGTLLVGWLVYDLACKSPLRHQPGVLLAGLFAFVVAVAWGLSQVLSPRAAYIHTGAMMGTMMAANVFFVIIPGQRDMVDAMMEGREPPLERGKAGSLRSLHNNYLTLPVLFIMVSNHFPSTYGHPMGWAALAAIGILGVMVRHWFNLRGQGESNVWLLPAATVGMLALAFVLKPSTGGAVSASGDTPSFATVQGIVQTRCTPCHATEPSHEAFDVAPKNFILETGAQILANKDLIHTQAVVNKIMPIGNLTGMTDEERGQLAAWYAAGAPER